MLPLHLQGLFGDLTVVSVVPDNACTHGKRQLERKRLERHHSADSTLIKASARRGSRRNPSRDAPARRLSRWESMPTTKSSSVSKDVAPVPLQRMPMSPLPKKDVAPVLTLRRKDSTSQPIITLTNSLLPRPRDLPPVPYRRSPANNGDGDSDSNSKFGSNNKPDRKSSMASIISLLESAESSFPSFPLESSSSSSVHEGNDGSGFVLTIRPEQRKSSMTSFMEMLDSTADSPIDLSSVQPTQTGYIGGSSNDGCLDDSNHTV